MNPDVATLTLPLRGDGHVVVPDSLDLITPYVLQEQHDWFEDEIRFLRRLLQPGQRVVDIGANYGVYTLAMARAVGPQGRVWAFEPAAQTAALLERSVELNGLNHVRLARVALSDVCGHATLAVSAHAETNALVQGSAASDHGEQVPVQTLDACLEQCGWRDIDFVKMDAEGAELRILHGGRRFLAELSPLVQYEVKSARRADLQLVHAFAALGYASYRLVPGLDLLEPFDGAEPVDGYLLNLFACKPERAEALAAAGWLVPAGAAAAAAEPWHLLAGRGWREGLAAFPYAVGLLNAETRDGEATAHATRAPDEALALYLLSRERDQPASVRLAALQGSFVRLRRLCEESATPMRLASLARVAQQLGARTVAVHALHALVQELVHAPTVLVHEPFLAPGERFDTLAPKPGELGHWLLAGALEELERLSAYSSFFPGLRSHRRLEAIRLLGFAGDEMGRRLQLLQQRFRLCDS